MPRIALIILLSAILVCMVASTSKIQSARASSTTIYITPDGTINGTTSIQTSDNITYVFTADIVEQPIVVQRNNSIIDGKGHSAGYGFSMSNVNNVTIRNSTITISPGAGIDLEYSSGIVLLDNNVTAGGSGLRLYYSSDNIISGNDLSGGSSTDCIEFWSSSGNVLSNNSVTTNGPWGIELDYSSDNLLSWNIFTSGDGGIHLAQYSDNNTLSGNKVTANGRYDIAVEISSSNNKIYHNSFIGSTYKVLSLSSWNTWDDGYPSGGNYWSDYLTKYPNATQVDSSGVWNTPYVIDTNNTDHYPLMNPYNVVSEFPFFFILPLFFITTLLAVVLYKKKV